MWLRELHVSRAGFSSRAKNSDTVDATETVNPITVDDSEDNHVLNSSENACDLRLAYQYTPAKPARAIAT